jgi:plastocyanin
MTSRVTATLCICALGAAITAGALFRPPTTITAATAGGSGAAATPTTLYGQPAATDDHADHGDAAPAPAAATGTIEISGFAFSAAGPFAPGQVVTVTNVDSAPHTLTSNDGLFDTGNIDPGGSATFVVPSEPGSFAFFCAVHPSMTGTFTVA